MAYFILTDSDWNWDDAEGENGEYGPVIVEAADEQEAVRLACGKMIEAGDDFDGAHFKIARLSTHAFAGVTKDEAGELWFDTVQFVAQDMRSKQEGVNGS